MSHEPFIGRKSELRALNNLLEKKVASLVVIRGRRRIGKSRLVKEFMHGKRSLILTGVAPTEKTTAQSQRDEFTRQLAAQSNFPEVSVNDWSKIFLLLFNMVKDSPTIILFDEISWMGSKDPDFLGQLKNAWDLYFKENPKLVLILCGSVSSWIEKNILSSTAFFGRVALTMTIEELMLNECNLLLNAIGFKRSAFEKLMLLSVTGGIPWYIELINPIHSANQNISTLCFDKDGTLVDEFGRIFHDLFGRRAGICKKITEYLANGPAEQTEIAVGLRYARSGVLGDYLKDLELSGFITRDYTWSFKTGADNATSRFRLRDNYLRFYLKYIAPRLKKIKLGQFAEVDATTFPNWDGIMGLQFENLVLNNRKIINAALGIKPQEIIAANPFFQGKTTKQQACQIDYLIQTKFKNLFVCEVKFSKNIIDASIITEMQGKISKLTVPKGFAVQPVLIHVNEVSNAVHDADYFFKIMNLSDFMID